MIIGVITAVMLLFGGGIFTFDSVRDAADEVIKDKQRAKQVIAITKQADKEYEAFTKNLDKLSKKLVEVNRNYDLTRDEMDAFSDKTRANRKTLLDSYVNHLFQMKDLITEEEWVAMHAKEKG